jgi:predicted DNA-binding protein YlxM (UPF0122 family)
VAKDLRIALLLDYYGELLTPKQQQVISFYYNDDLSLSEIAQNEGITRQGVRDAIKRGEAQLVEMEEKLGLLRHTRALQDALADIRKRAENVRDYNSRFVYDKAISEQMEKLVAAISKVQETVG